jgi:tRNA (cytidine/uridine-2'-O-)-methyltransferase
LFHIVLFEPEIPGNTGNVIRLCANTGATLHLIRPLGFRVDDKSLRRSGLDYHDLALVRIHSDLAACRAALADSRWFAVETGGRSLYSAIAYRRGDVFLFGPETRGLPPDLVGGDSVSIPMRGSSRSLTLANAVALVVYEAWRQTGFSD